MNRRSNTSASTSAAQSVWSYGDYDRFATELVWEIGPVLVEAAGVTPRQRVLDVAAGTGNVAIRAAEAGAEVVAVDITPALFDAGRRHARERGVQVRWVEGDAQALPFDDREFDVVTSSFGVIFAPDHQRAADELLRVCRPGGTIALANFRPDALAGAFFELFARHAPPPPPGAHPPTQWGDEGYVSSLFRDRVSSLTMERREYVERAATPAAYRAFFEETFGPLVALRVALADQPERAAAFDRDFAELTVRWNRGATGEGAEYPYAYLLVVASPRG